jgi:adenylate kinase family enzyme
LHEENAALLEEGKPAWFGWTLEDYPQTANQAKCLEATLTGYDDEREQHQQQLRTSSSSFSSSYASPLAPVRAPTVLSPRERLGGKSGVDLVFLMDADRETVRNDLRSVRERLRRRGKNYE